MTPLGANRAELSTRCRCGSATYSGKVPRDQAPLGSALVPSPAAGAGGTDGAGTDGAGTGGSGGTGIGGGGNCAGDDGAGSDAGLPATCGELHLDERITAVGLFAEAYTGLVTRLSGQLADHGLSLIEFEVLIRLARSPDTRLRMTELAGQVALTTSGITRVVDRLARGDLVRREACPSDRRGAWAVLTGAGMDRVTAALPGHLAEVERHFTGRFPADELDRFVGWLRDLRDDLHPAYRGRTGGRNRHAGGSPVDLPDETVNGHR